MKKELQDKLYEKYPNLFIQHKLPMTHTAMCWGCQCGDGWNDIIDDLCTRLQEHIDKTGCPQVEFSTVKEKFGGLRLYHIGGDDETYKMISDTEHLSFCICEHCGSAEDVSQTKGWIVTLCPECMAKYKKERKL